MWDYAELSRDAKEAGGPEDYANSLIEYGKEKGHEEMLPAIVAVAVLGILGGAKIQKYFTDRKSMALAKVEYTKARLSQWLKHSDAPLFDEDVIENDTSEKDD